MRLRPALPLLVLPLLTAAPAAAQAPPVAYQGETGQSKRIAVQTDAQQRVSRVTIAWTASCRRGRGLSTQTVVVPPRRTVTRDRFATAGAFTMRQKGGYRIRVRLSIEGLRDTAVANGGDRWTGTMTVSAVVRRRGKVVDRCRLPMTVWSAVRPGAAPPAGLIAPVTAVAPSTSAPAGSSGSTGSSGSSGGSGGTSREVRITSWSFEMTGDAGDYITGGQRWVHGPPDTLTSSAGGAVLNLNVSTADGWWSIDFAAPQGQQLTAGTRYTDARRYPFNDAGAGLSVSGMGRGCNELTGEFTVHELSYDARGVLARFKASFVQHCEGGSAAARGTIELTAAPA